MNILPTTGAALIYGRLSNWQSNIAFQLAMEVAIESGRDVVFLLDKEDGASSLPLKVITYRNAAQVPVGSRMRVSSLDARTIVDAANPAKEFQERHSLNRPALIVRDTSCSPRHRFYNDDKWYEKARGLAYDLKTCVLSVVHTGNLPGSEKPEIETDVQIRATSFHSKALGNSMCAQLDFEKPEQKTMRFAGRQAGSLVVFSEMESVNA